MQLWYACRQEIQYTELRLYEYKNKHNFACVFAYTQCAKKKNILTITVKIAQEIKFITTFGVTAVSISFYKIN